MRKLIFGLYTILNLLPAVSTLAQDARSHRFEAAISGGELRLPTPYRSGYFYRQQLTGYIRPRIGVSLGLTWGSSANLDALATRNPAPDANEPWVQPDPAQLGTLYQRSEQMTDVSVVVLPLLTRRHQLKVQAGLSVYRRKETSVDSLIYPEPRLAYYEMIPRQSSTARLVPMVAAGYDFRLSNRWGVGVNGTAYFTGASAPTTTVGLRATYRFGLIADSLGFAPIRWNEASWGIRAAASAVTEIGYYSGIHQIRFNGGLWAEVPLSLTWAMRGELSYAQRGSKTKALPQRRVPSTFAKTNYLELPLLFRHEVAYHWHLYAGPYLAFFLNGFGEVDGQREEPIRAQTTSGLMLGASYNLTNRLAADLRYQRDMVVLSTAGYYGSYHSFQLGLNYAFGKKP